MPARILLQGMESQDQPACCAASVPLADHVEEHQLGFKRNPISYEGGGCSNERGRPAEEESLFLA